MGQQIGDDKTRILRVAADDHVHRLAGLERHDAVQLQRDRDPLVLLDAAVIVRLEIAQLVRLIHRDLLEVETRGVDVRPRDDTALAQRFLADHGQHQCLSAVILIDLVPRLERHTRHIGHKTAFLSQRDRAADSLALGARLVQPGHVIPAVVLQAQPLGGVNPVIAVFLLIEKLFSQVTHVQSPSTIFEMRV